MKVIPVQTYSNRKPIKTISFKNNSPSEVSSPVKTSDDVQFTKNLNATKLDPALYNPIGEGLKKLGKIGKKVGEQVMDFFVPRSMVSDYNHNGDITDELVAMAPFMY